MTTLKIGSRGSDVTALQDKLNSLGYNVGKADGIFGRNTEIALKEYQKSLGVTPDGVLGSWVHSKLFNGVNTVASSGTKGLQVTITAGHSNTDPGAVNGSYTEANLAVEMRNGVAKRLRDKGVTVYTDGEGSDNKNLNAAIALAKKTKVSIEFHLNAAVNKSAKGVEALAQPKDKKICKDICAAVSNMLETPIRGEEGGWKNQGSGQHSRLGYVIAGGIVMESFFISNDLELRKYFARKEALFDALADAIYKNL